MLIKTSLDMNALTNVAFIIDFISNFINAYHNFISLL